MTLKELAIGKSAVIRTVGASGALRQHFLDMGMIPGAEVTVVKFAPMGDPMELQVHGYELTLRLAEAEQIEVEEISERTNSHSRGERLKPVDHPGLGEEGKYHSEEDANPLPDGTVLTYALVGNHGSIDVNTMEALLGVPVIPISAAKNEGVDEVIRHALHVAKYQERPLRQDFCDKSDHDGAVHRCIHAVIHLIEDHAEEAKLPVRFAATKAIEGDPLILEQLKLDQNELDMLGDGT